MKRIWFAGTASVAAIAVAVLSSRHTRKTAEPPIATVATFVGEAVCASCHAPEAAAWTGSHHQRAMQPANATTVLGNFAGASFAYGDVTSQLFQRAGKYVARTDGPDGKLHDYEIEYTFGVSPLQQYLVRFPGGRFQALEIAWDSRPSTAGGQRWFHLHPDEHIDHKDELHWTGPAENWNFMCADCHSTNVRKAWSEQTSTYATQFSEMSVSCEACHGPGSRHVTWARESPAHRSSDNGLAIALDERAGVSWLRDAAGKPARNHPRTSEREIEMCARCHSRRGSLHEDAVRGQPVSDDYRVALLDEDLYYPDGQIRGEVYEYGSFVQSRMYAEGVTCSDCHDPHSGKPRAPANGVCLQCHAPTYATAKHHFHAAGAHCTGCHMPTTSYMVIDARHDHSLRIPRPDQSVKLGVPNACNRCHADRSAAWAAATVDKWYGHTPSGFQQFADALDAGTRGAPGAQAQLAGLVRDSRQPAIARATALSRLEQWPNAVTVDVARTALGDASPLVRRAAVHALRDTDPRTRVTLLSPLLADAVRSVRIEAADALSIATPELLAAEHLNSDRPEAHLALANLYVRQHAPGRAEAELVRALAIDPAFIPASVNLADLYRALGRDDAGEPVLRAALERAPNNPALLHALGLLLVREKGVRAALEPLAAAARLGPNDPRHGYVYAVALHELGKQKEAVTQLEDVVRRHPYDHDSLAALVAFLREAGELRKALSIAEQLVALDPQDAAAQATVTQLRATAPRDARSSPGSSP